MGFVLRQIRRRLDHSPTEIAIALLSGYFAYLPAEAAGVSAVLAVVTVGIYVGWYTPELTTAQTRLQGDAVWDIIAFLLNALVFGLVGLQLRPILDSLSGRSTSSLIGDALIVSGAVIVTRLVWIYPATYVPRFLFRRIRERDPYPPWQFPTVIGWAGLRGAVSLAAALALPLTTDSGGAFPDRDLVIYLAFCVILATLVFQGLTLPGLIRVLRPRGRRHGREGRGQGSHPLRPGCARPPRRARRRGLGARRHCRAPARAYRSARTASPPASTTRTTARSSSAPRTTSGSAASSSTPSAAPLVELRRQGRINDEIMNLVQRDLDLEDARLDA